MSSAPVADTTMGEEPQLVFHPDFSVKYPDSIILRAEVDGTSFYFSRSLLSALSPFFATIPDASLPQDSFNGTSVIPLDTTGTGLNVFFQALKSTASAEPLVLKPGWMSGSDRDCIVDAAIIAGIFDCPIVFRLLDEAMHCSGHRDAYHRYAIWVFAKVPAKVTEAAIATLPHRITQAGKKFIKGMKQHAPVDWARLQDFHLRRIQGMAMFHERPQPNEYDHPYIGHHSPCEETGEPIGRIENLFAQAESVEAVKRVRDTGYGMKCESCIEEADSWYGGCVQDLVDLALEY